MKNDISLCIFVGLWTMSSCFGAVYVLKDGATDWGDPASYVNNAVPTLPSDVITTEANATNVIRSDDPAYQTAFDKINLVDHVEIGDWAHLEIEVAAGVEKTITGRILAWRDGSGIIRSTSVLDKTGAGTLYQEPQNREDAQYFPLWNVHDGALGAPWAKGQVDDSRLNLYAQGGLHVAAGARFLASFCDYLQVMGPLTGEGLIETLNPNAKGSYLYVMGGPGDFSGTIGTNFIVRIRGGQVNLLSSANEFDGGLIIGNGNGRQGIVGFSTFGSSGSVASSLGRRPTISLGSYDVTAGTLCFLGSVPETIESKSILVQRSIDSPATIDAGAFGGLVFGPNVKWQIATGEDANQRICLSGSNTMACVFGGSLLPADNSPNHNFYLTKKGTGVWQLNENVASRFAGAIRVEDGVLRYDSLASKGALCALGTATRLFDDACTPFADETPVDYAILFGGAGKGTLEYCGAFDAFCTNRPVRVETGGAFSTATKATRLHDVAAVGQTAELVILATNDAVCTYADLFDGEHGGRLAVTKRGAGTAELDRTLTFSGLLKVEEGRLVVRNSSGHYTWFRLLVKQNFARLKGAPDSDDPNLVIVERFALYDADGTRQNVGFGLYDGNLSPTVSGYAVKTQANCIRPGQVGYDRVGEFACWRSSGNRNAANMCDVTSSSKTCYTRFGDKPALSVDDPATWVKFTFRLTNGTPEIAAWDIATRFGTADSSNNRFRAPTQLEIQGSVDGLSWDSLTNYQHAVVTDELAVINGGRWYSDGTTMCYGTVGARRWQDGKSFPLRGSPVSPVRFNVLGNCESVAVAPGAELVKAGAEPVTIKGLTVSKNGFGRIEGFTLSEDPMSTLTILSEDPKCAFTIPGEFVGMDTGALAQWNVSVGGRIRSGYYRITATAGGITVTPPGMVVILR